MFFTYKVLNLAQSMKRFLLLILSVCYLTASSGAVVHLHYCMDKLIGWGFWEKNGKTDKCDKCGMSKSSKKKSCCKDENKFVKIEKDQKTTEASYKLTQPVIAAVAVNLIFNTLVYFLSSVTVHPGSNAPPLSALADTYLLNCNFRI